LTGKDEFFILNSKLFRKNGGNILIHNDYEWHEFIPSKEDVWPTGFCKKIKFYADANIPHCMIEELRNSDFSVDSVIEKGYASHSDENIYHHAKESGKVIFYNG
jgi:hypothetical protein